MFRIYSGQDNDNSSGDGWPDERIAYSGVSPIELYRYNSGSGAYDHLHSRSFYEGAINEPALVEVDGNSDGDLDDLADHAYIPLLDDRGTVMGVATGKSGTYNGISRNAGDLIEKIYYNSTGLVRAYYANGTFNSQHPNRSSYIDYGWCGMPRSRFTGLYHTHYRDYDAIHGRWLNEDPAGYADGLNLFNNYAGVNGVDALGLDRVEREEVRMHKGKLERCIVVYKHKYSWSFGRLSGRYQGTTTEVYIKPAAGGMKDADVEFRKDRQKAVDSIAGLAGTVEVGMEWGIRLNPISDIYETITGNDVISGEDLAWWEHALSGCGIAGGVAGKGVDIALTGRKAAKLSQAVAKKYGVKVSSKGIKSLNEFNAAAKEAIEQSAKNVDNVTDAAKVTDKTADAAKVTPKRTAGQTVGGLRAAGSKDAHHVIQDAAVREIPGYNTNAAPGVQLSGPSSVRGTPHYRATQVQRQMGGGTYAAERRIGYKSLRRAGLSETEARRAIQQADDYFRSLGVGR